MLFNSLDFLLFLPICLGIYYILPATKRWIFLLLASYFFYAGWKVSYLGLIVFSTLVDYFISNFISTSNDQRKRKIALGLSLFSNFSLLILFKYFHFFVGGAGWFKTLANSNESILWLQFIFEYGIPVGISFYTFQTVSYTLDVYHRRIEPERNLGKFALYVTFFPQLVAGPIERFSHLHPQLFRAFKPKWTDFRTAFQFVLLGFFLKMVIGDGLGSFIAPIFNAPENFSVAWKTSAVALFGIQIYTDFNGYSLIAIGVAQLFGVQLMDNFRSPYGAFSIRDFWARWHISLSTWFRDYVYIPLGGSKKGKKGWILAIILTFGLSGLWHGASANFIYWGLIHGLFYLVEQQFFPYDKAKKVSVSRKNRDRFAKISRWSVTMFVVGFAWLLFRAENMRKVYAFFESGNELKLTPQFSIGLSLSLLFFILLEISMKQTRLNVFLDRQSKVMRWSLYSLFLICILFFSDAGDMQFIYFQF